MIQQIYLDNAATTQVDNRVLEKIVPCFNRSYGNPASIFHEYGKAAESLVDQARQSVADLLGAASLNDIVFTSGATEANDLAIWGVVNAAANGKRGHIITSKIEHASVLETCRQFEREGGTVTYLDVAMDGRIDPAEVESAIRQNTILVSIIAANNEVGTTQPLSEIAKLTRKRGIPFHTDATQFAGSGQFNVIASGVDLASLSAHKFYGPKGVGALYVRRSENPVPIVGRMAGGGQQDGLRPGTVNVPCVVGLGHAAELVQANAPSEAERIRNLRDRLFQGLRTNIDGVMLNGSLEHRLPSILNVSIPGVSSLALISAVQGVAFSAGSACSSRSGKVSHVLEAMGLDRVRALGAVRFSVGRFNTVNEIDEAIAQISDAVARIRGTNVVREVA